MIAISEAQASGDHRQRQKLRVHAILWNALGAGSIGYALTELMDNLPAQAIDRKLWCLRSDPSSPRQYDRPIYPHLLFRAFAKAGISARAQGRIGRRVAMRRVGPGDIVYLWPPYDPLLIKEAHNRGAIVIAERTNCMSDMGLKVLSRAYGRRGRPLPTGWFPPQEMAEEREIMRQCDFVTAPNPFVTQSLLDAGVHKNQVLETSYGFNPHRLANAIGISRPRRPPVFAFVGLGIVRKGLDVLLEAWGSADIKGTLLIAGLIDEEIRQSYTHILNRTDVQELGFVQDVANVYAAADVFVFPSHEEGGPQVIYEAAGCGLPSIVSPMGAGRIVRNGRECIIIDPLDVDDLARAMVQLAEDRQFRVELSCNSVKRAEEFTWGKVGLRLYDQFRDIADRARSACK